METNVHIAAESIGIDPIGQFRVQIVGPGRLQSLWTEPIDWVTAKLVVNFNDGTCPGWLAIIRLNNRGLHRDAEEAFRLAEPASIRTLRMTEKLPDGNTAIVFAVRYVRIIHENPLPETSRCPGVLPAVSQEKGPQLSPPLVALEAHHLGGDFEDDEAPLMPPAWLIALVDRLMDLHGWAMALLFFFPALLLTRLWRSTRRRLQ